MNNEKYCIYPEYPDCSNCEFSSIVFENELNCFGFACGPFKVICTYKKSDVEKESYAESTNNVENNDLKSE